MSSPPPMPVEPLSYAPVARDPWLALPKSVGVLGAVCAAILLLSSLVSLVALVSARGWFAGQIPGWQVGPVSLDTLLGAAIQALKAVAAALMLTGAIQRMQRVGGRQLFTTGLVLLTCGSALNTLLQMVVYCRVYSSIGPGFVLQVLGGVLGNVGQVLILVLLIVVLRPRSESGANRPAA